VKNLTWQNPGQLFVAQELIKIVKLKCCGIKEKEINQKKLLLLFVIIPFKFLLLFLKTFQV